MASIFRKYFPLANNDFQLILFYDSFKNQAMLFHFDLSFDLEEEPHFSHPLASIAILLWAIYRCIYKQLFVFRS